MAQLQQSIGLLHHEPGFVNFPTDYRLRPDSSAVDAADPQADYGRELGYNGNRADLGAYGNTWQAAQQPPLTQMGITLEADTVQQTAWPGQTLTYTLRVKNSGMITDVYTIVAESQGYLFRSSLYENGRLNPRPVELAPQEEISVTVWVDVPLAPHFSLSHTVSVRAFNGYGIRDEIELTVMLPASFQETGGQVVMEVEHFGKQVEQSGRNWLTQTRFC